LPGLLTSLLMALFTALLAFPQLGHAQDKAITIGTGGTSGVYYPVGGAICSILQRGKATHGLTCSAESTGGSVDNVERLRAGTLDFALVQSDVLFYAFNGFGPFKGKGPNTTLRSVVSLHTEAFTVLARADAGIRTFDDLRAKRVNIGNEGSGQRTFMELLLRVKKWDADAFVSSQLPADQQAQALCANQVDAIVYVVGHPNGSIKQATASCDTILVNVYDDDVKKMIETYPFFVPATIPGKYPGNPATTHTFGVTANLATTANSPDNVVFEMTRTLLNSFTDLKFSHTALFDLTPTAMVNRTTTPMHPGAMRFIKQSTNLSERMKVRPAPR